MCTSPVSVTRNFKDGSSRVDVVPCGKCPECRAKAQSEFAALSVREAESAGKIGFITLTYNDKFLPLWLRSSDGSCKLLRCSETDFHFEKCGPKVSFDSIICPSLCRKDVQSFIKRYRQDFFRREEKRLDFRYTFFGEYGERFRRPHYHMLVFGLEESELRRLLTHWKFGFTDLKFITHFNADGSDAFAKVSRYVSKYVGKRDMLPAFVRNGYAEVPRKQSSIRLGVRFARRCDGDHCRRVDDAVEERFHAGFDGG